MEQGCALAGSRGSLGTFFFSLDDKELEAFAQNTWNLRFPRFRTVRHPTITLRTEEASSGPVAITLEVKNSLQFFIRNCGQFQ